MSNVIIETPNLWERRFLTISAVCSCAVSLAGILVLVGWTFGITTLVRVVPSFTSMKPNTAVVFVALGVALWLARSRAPRSVRLRRILGAFVAAVAAATLVEYVFGVDLRIDQVLHVEDASNPFPGRMAVATAVTFVFLGLALVLPDRGRSTAASRAAGLVALAVSLIALFGYLYDVSSLYSIGLYTSVALHTAIASVLASCALLMARPDTGITGLFTSDTEAGGLLRRLLPAIVLVPVGVGWLLLHGRHEGYLDTPFAIALMVLSTTTTLTLFTTIVAASLQRSELLRREADRALQADVDAMTRLNKVATFFTQTAPLPPVLLEILDAAIAISGADFGSVQILDPKSSDLRIAAARGLPDWWSEFWNSVTRGHGACGTALDQGRRVIVEDVEESPIFAGTPALAIQRSAGIRAVQSTPLFTRSGEPIGMFSTHFKQRHRPDEHTLRKLDLLARQAADILERAQVDARIRESEQRFRSLVDASSQIVWTTDAMGNVVDDTPSWRSFTGQTYEQVRGSGWLDALHPEDRDRVARAWQDAVRSKTRFATEYRIHDRDGQWRWTSVSGVPLFDDSGNVSGWIGMNIDITAKKRAEAARERGLREIVENAPTAVAVLDREMRYVEASPRWLRDYGLGPDVIGKSHYELFPELPEHWKAVHRRCLAGATEENDGEPFTRSDGRVQWARWKVCPWRNLDDAIVGIVMYADDITEQRSVVDAARAAHAQLRLAQRVGRIGTFEWGLQNQGNTWTRELEEMYGLPIGTFPTTLPDWERLVHPDDVPEAVRRLNEAVESGAPGEGEWRVRWPDGSIHWISGRFQVFKDESGRPLRMVGANIEITERKRAEEAQRKLLDEVRDLTRNLEVRVLERTNELAIARDRLHGIISMAPNAIISIDNDQRITIFNRGAEEIFGWRQEEVLGKPLDLLLPDHFRADHREHIARFANESTEIRRMADRATVLGLRKSGERFPAEAAISKLQIGGKYQFTVVLRDITERKRLEEEQARRYEERTVLLKEIHHRVKNNLQVLSSLFYLQAQQTSNESVRKLLDESRSRLYSISLIHDKLYRSERLSSIDFGDYLRDLTASLASTFGVQAPNVRVHVEVENVFLDIERAIPCALVVNELVSNAMKHGFPGGRRGEIRVDLRAIDSDLQLEVRDTGVGFPPDLDFRRVTTLGLQLVTSLTSQLHGTVELVRDQGGTIFRIRFPTSPARAEAPAQVH